MWIADHRPDMAWRSPGSPVRTAYILPVDRAVGMAAPAADTLAQTAGSMMSGNFALVAGNTVFAETAPDY